MTCHFEIVPLIVHVMEVCLYAANLEFVFMMLSRLGLSVDTTYAADRRYP